MVFPCPYARFLTPLLQENFPMPSTLIHIARSAAETLHTSERLSLAVKIAHLGYEISLYLADAGPSTNLTGQELRVYAPGLSHDHTAAMCVDLGFPLGGHVDATAENIRLAMGWIEYQVSLQTPPTDAGATDLDKAVALVKAMMQDMGEGRNFLPFEKDPNKRVSVRRMPSIPAGANPFHHDAMSMGTELVRGWIVMHPGYDAPTPEKGAQYPIQWVYMVNRRTGNRFRLEIGENF